MFLGAQLGRAKPGGDRGGKNPENFEIFIPEIAANASNFLKNSIFSCLNHAFIHAFVRSFVYFLPARAVANYQSVFMLSGWFVRVELFNK